MGTAPKHLLRHTSWLCFGQAVSLAVALTGLAADSGSELLLFSEPVVTAATKHPKLVADAPSSVTLITRADIERFGYRTLAEALGSVRGFYQTYDRTYSFVGVRGFLRPSDFNDRILLLVNGHSYNDDVFQQAFLGPTFGIDMESIARIEIVRGPGAALYGGNALFAVVNVVTVDAADVEGVQLLAETGSFDRKRGRLGVGHRFANGLEVVASASVLDVAGRESLYYREYDRPETHDGVASRGDAEQAWRTFLSARWGDFFFQGGVSSRWKQIPTGAYGTVFNQSDTTVTDQRNFAEFRWDRPVARGTDVHARLYYDGYWYHGTYIYGGGPTGLTDNEDTARSHWWGGELQVRRRLFARNDLTVGAEFSHHPSALQKNWDWPTGTLYLKDRQEFTNWGVYVQDEWAILPSVSIVAGVRFDRYYHRIEEVSPRGAIIWRPALRTNVKLMVGRAFRPPNLFEQFYQTPTDIPSQIPNPDIEAETMLTYEAVLEQGLPHGVDGLISLYRYDIDGLVDQVLSADRSTVRFVNLDDVEANGIEFELRVPLPREIEARGSYALQETTSGGRRLTNSPIHLGQAHLLVPLPYDVTAGLQLVVVGPRRTLDRRSVDTVTLLNLTVRSPSYHGFWIAGSGYNLLDQEYDDPAGPEARQRVIPQDGATWRIQVGYAF